MTEENKVMYDAPVAEAEQETPVTEQETPKTRMVVVKEDIAGVDLMAQLNEPNEQFYCSIVNDGTRASQIKIYNAINSVDETLAEHINEVLEIVNIVAHPIELTDEETGEIFTALRTVLIDKNGISYGAVSGGITNSLARIFAIVGKPDGGAWEDEPVKIKVKQVQTRNGNNKVNTIELVG